MFENVIGLLTHGHGSTFKSIIEVFGKIGYRTSARVINCAHFGLPQKKERLILIGSPEGKAISWLKPTHRFRYKSMAGKSDLLSQYEEDPGLPEALTFFDATSDLPSLRSGESATEYGSLFELTQYQKAMRAGTDQLTLHNATRHSARMLEIIGHVDTNISALPPGLITSGFSSCYNRLAANEPGPCGATLLVNMRDIEPRKEDDGFDGAFLSPQIRFFCSEKGV